MGGTAESARMFRLRDLGFLARLGVACLVLVMVGGSAASGVFLYLHHQNRDERAGLTVDDVRAHYHGITAKAPLIVALEDGHPEGIAAADRDDLLAWLRGDPAKLAGQYDNLDLGDRAPVELIAANCTSCHSRTAKAEGAYPQLPLDYWDDVRSVAISREINPVGVEILSASTHTHALGMASMGFVMVLFALLTSWPRPLVGLVSAACGVGLLADVGGWWVTREVADAAYMVVAGGAMFNGGIGVLGLLILLDLCMPRGTAKPAAA